MSYVLWYMLCISTSEQVLYMLFAGQNKKILKFQIFSRKGQEKRRKRVLKGENTEKVSTSI